MNQEVSYGIIIVFLTVNAYLDWKKHEISLWSTLIFGAAGILVQTFFGGNSWGEIAGGAALGVFVLAVAFFTKEAIGFGDGLIVGSLGLWLGFWNTLQIFTMSMLLCTLISGLLELCNVIEKKERIPLIPFLLLAYLLWLIL